MTTNTHTGCCKSTESTTSSESSANTCCARPATRRRVYTPAIDVSETADSFIVSADVPGARPEGVDLRVDDGVLTLKASVTPRESGGSPRREYGVGDYERAFRIGEGIDVSAISAALDNGVLTVRLPKAESAKPRKIEVGAK